VLIDPKIRNFSHYRPSSLITPNHHEALRMTNIEEDSDEGLHRAALIIREKLDCDAVLITRGDRGEMEDMLQPGRRQVAAGYVIYGSSTMLVYTTGQGAHGFTLDPSIGEFLLSHPNIKTPNSGRYLSVNDSYERLWDEDVRALMRRYRGLDGERTAMNVRYVGSLVADFHRNLLGGGLFAYPSNQKKPRGKLRLLYEANPLAFIVEQAGGAAIDGRDRILDLEPTDLHQRTPLYIGSKGDVDIAKTMLAGVPTEERPLAAR